MNFDEKRDSTQEPGETRETRGGTCYLSLDIGIRNMAICIVEMSPEHVPSIIQWEKIDILRENGIEMKNSKHFPASKLFRLIHTTLVKRLYWWKQQFIDIILIESQIGQSRNAKMEGMIAMWLHIHFQVPIHPVSAQWKLRVDFDGAKWALQDRLSFSSHAKRKDFAVQLVDRWTKTQPPFIRQFFEKHGAKTKKASKQDDLADAFLQAVAWHLKSV